MTENTLKNNLRKTSLFKKSFQKKASAAKKSASQNKILWDNDFSERYYDLLDDGYSPANIWGEFTHRCQEELTKEAVLLDKYVDGTIYLIGSIQKYGQLYPAARSLKTNHIGTALKNAIDALSKKDSRLTLSISEDELVITQYTRDSQELPSVFSFRCVPEDVEAENMSADLLAENSSSIASVVMHAHEYT